MKRIIQIVCLTVCFYPFIIKAELSNPVNSFQKYSIATDTLVDNIIISNVFNYSKGEVYYINSLNPNALISFTFTIYNRWGAIIYESDDIDEGWDGTEFSAGVYYYVLEFELSGEMYCDSSSKYNQSGSISLVK